MPKFKHTIKDSEPVKTDDTVEIEWSLEVSGGELRLIANKIDGLVWKVITISREGDGYIHGGAARQLGLPHGKNGELIIA